MSKEICLSTYVEPIKTLEEVYKASYWHNPLMFDFGPPPVGYSFHWDRFYILRDDWLLMTEEEIKSSLRESALEWKSRGWSPVSHSRYPQFPTQDSDKLYII